jgi:hypothetical protein
MTRTPTQEQLRMAWPIFRGRHGCPDTVEQALAHPKYGPCLRAAALDMGRAPMSAHSGAAAAAASRLGANRWVPPTPDRPRPRLGAHDAKRAAANDRDEE